MSVNRIRLFFFMLAKVHFLAFYPISYTDFKYNIFVYLDDILQVEWNINVIIKVFEVQPAINRSRFYPIEMRKKMLSYAAT